MSDAAAACRVELAVDGRIAVTGELVFATVGAARVQALRLFSQARAMRVDLGGVSKADSAGLALLIEWMREARRRHQNVHFEHIPDGLRVIAELSDVESLLPA